MTDEPIPTSALYWLPPLQADDALRAWIPPTRVVPYDHRALIDAAEGDGKYEDWPRVLCDAGLAGDDIGWPVFVKTDLTSAKHDGPSHYRADSRADMRRVLIRTAEDSELKLWTRREASRAFLIRRFLDLDAPFVAFGGLPVAREWRFFATAEGVLCAHPYWPEGAVEESFYIMEANAGPEGWREQLAELYRRPDTLEWALMGLMAQKAAALCPRAPAWAVDFARDRSCRWWLIDMADAREAWHWTDCPETERIKSL